jgi:hypothetical protein
MVMTEGLNKKWFFGRVWLEGLVISLVTCLVGGSRSLSDGTYRMTGCQA